MRRFNLKRPAVRYSVFLGVVYFVLAISLGAFTFSDWFRLKSEEQDLRLRIARIVKESTKDGEGIVNGVKVYTRRPLRSEFIEEIKGYGIKAVSTLAEYLEAEDNREQRIAVELLGHIGGPSVIVPLTSFILDERVTVTNRLIALRWLSAVDSDEVRIFISNLAEEATDTRLRNEAQRLLDALDASV